MTLNLKNPRARGFERLAKKADVVVENFRPDVASKLGIDYDARRERCRTTRSSGLGREPRDQERQG